MPWIGLSIFMPILRSVIDQSNILHDQYGEFLSILEVFPFSTILFRVGHGSSDSGSKREMEPLSDHQETLKIPTPEI